MDDASICESINIDLDSLCDTVFPLIFDASLYAIVLGAVCIFEEKSEHTVGQVTPGSATCVCG